jgi:uncharacterized protein (DUF1697 family)
VTAYIALLRGINVGGNKLVAMAELRKLCGELGLEGVTTLLQSGNVVFRSAGRTAAQLESLLVAEIAQRFGMNVDVFVRSSLDWKEIVASNPFLEDAASDPSHLVVVFLHDPVDETALQAVRNAVAGRETFQALGDHLYVVYPDGIGPSKLPKTPGWNKLVGHGTARNWNTVLKLATIASDSG